MISNAVEQRLSQNSCELIFRLHVFQSVELDLDRAHIRLLRSLPQILGSETIRRQLFVMLLSQRREQAVGLADELNGARDEQ